MIRFKMMLFALFVACATVAAAQPCYEGTCFEGHFCDLPSFVCRPCLSCEDLKREEPHLKSLCIKSIKECGPCMKDLVDSGDLTCVPRSGDAPPPPGNSTTLWIIAGIVIAMFVVVLAAVVIRYMFRNSMIKLHLDTNIGATLPTHVVATAPECPPPYSPPHASDLPRPGEDTEHPLIKPYHPPFPERESLDHQNVSIFNPPEYVRLKNFTPIQPEVYNDVNDNYTPVGDDEDTTPSPWGPGANYTVTTPEPAVTGESACPPPQESAAARAGDLSAALAVARNTDLVQPPHVTLRMLSTNGNDVPNSDDDTHAHHHAHGASGRTHGNGHGNYNVMNVNQVITIIKPPI